ncbi:hypothetical protein GGE06_005134 [Streptomyces sp. SFB5A]|uniref:Uncharacterized protein n=1 Tax=Streptomyces nymphaeiformis TaxID=2663842 RepID=A0A7W7U366_9ACTN|nr:hypothetical protein [Streptomyces nymphaeiformis]
MIPGSEPHNGDAAPDALHRWARRDAEPFLAAHPLPDEPLPLPDLNPYLTALAEAETPAEVSAVTHQLFGATAPLLDHIASHFVALALWAGHEHRHTPKTVSYVVRRRWPRCWGGVRGFGSFRTGCGRSWNGCPSAETAAAGQ